MNSFAFLGNFFIFFSCSCFSVPSTKRCFSNLILYFSNNPLLFKINSYLFTTSLGDGRSTTLKLIILKNNNLKSLNNFSSINSFVSFNIENKLKPIA